MNAVTTHERSRLERLVSLLAQDPQNPLLLAETAEAALAAGDLDEADRLVDLGMQAEARSPAWRFRAANVKIARKQLDAARALLEGLRTEGVRAPAIDHNLAYVAFLQSDYMQCAKTLEPWLSHDAGEPGIDAMQALWLRCMHHLDRLDEAWAFAKTHKLGLAAVGVASLVGVDLGAVDEAEVLSSAALAKVPNHLEASIARACIAAARGQHAEAARIMEPLAAKHPHQLRAWLTLGWLQLLSGDLAGARSAFEKSVAADANSADAHAGLAVTSALAQDNESASRHASIALQLEPGHPVAESASAIVNGDAKALEEMQRRAGEWLQRRR